MTNRQDFSQPVIVVGSGIAGLLLSIELADEGCNVILVTKGRLEESNTAWAQGGLAAVTSQNTADTKEQHLADTIAAGDGLSDPIIAERIISDGANLVQRLSRHGVKFDPATLALEGGHKIARVLHSADATGRAIVDALISTAKKQKQIRVMENCLLKELLVNNDRACGVVVTDGFRTTSELGGRAVVLATGGLGQVYSRTTNPSTATGDGIVAAYRAGAHLVDLEFVQFHPTALHLKGAPPFLISEAARGAGAILLDKNAKRFMHKFHISGELATRDIVSRAIFSTMRTEDTEFVWLDMRPIGEKVLMEQFPNILERLRSFGIDPVTAPVPVSPAAHYFMGGILTDECGRTTVEGLYAIGECASTGLHGANRLASNSLLEGGVMAIKLSRLLSNEFEPITSLNLVTGDLRSDEENNSTPNVTRELPLSSLENETFRKEIFRAAGIFRSELPLLDLIEKYKSSPNTVLGVLIAKAALRRRESRGAHCRQDYPTKNNKDFNARLVVSERDGFQWMPSRPTVVNNVSAVAAL